MSNAPGGTRAVTDLDRAAVSGDAAAQAAIAGMTSFLRGEPWEERFRSPPAQQNYEVGRLLAADWRRSNHIAFPSTFTALQNWWISQAKIDLACDLACTVPTTNCPQGRPKHLVLADLHISLKASGLEALSEEELY